MVYSYETYAVSLSVIVKVAGDLVRYGPFTHRGYVRGLWEWLLTRIYGRHWPHFIHTLTMFCLNLISKGM